MRPLEILLFALALFLLLSSSGLFALARFKMLAAGLALGLIVIHLLWEGYRWQMMPLYFILTLFSVYVLAGLTFFGVWQRWVKVISWSLTWVTLVLGLVLCLVLPVPILPHPSGSHAIGVVYHSFLMNEENTFSQEAGDKRKIYMKIWYPAEKSSGAAAPYLEQPQKTAGFLATLLGLPSFIFNHLKLAKTHNTINAAMSRSEKYPLLIFSHGYGSWFGQNTPLMEQLASHGYIVASIGHAYLNSFDAASATEGIMYDTLIPLSYKDGETVEMDQIKIFSSLKHEVYLLDSMARVIQDSSPLTKEYCAMWVRDIHSAIDEMVALNKQATSLFSGSIDEGKIGAFGMSFGGASSIESAMHDARIKSVANMDGWQYGNLLNDSIAVPALYLEGPLFDGPVFSRYIPFFERNKAESYSLFYKQAKHLDFTDLGLLLPVLKKSELQGKIKTSFIIQSMNDVMLNYFDATLKGEGNFDPQVFASEEVVAGTFSREK